MTARASNLIHLRANRNATQVLFPLFGYSGEGEHRFRREGERHSGAKVNSSRSEATLAW